MLPRRVAAPGAGRAAAPRSDGSLLLQRRGRMLSVAMCFLLLASSFGSNASAQEQILDPSSGITSPVPITASDQPTQTQQQQEQEQQQLAAPPPPPPPEQQQQQQQLATPPPPPPPEQQQQQQLAAPPPPPPPEQQQQQQQQQLATPPPPAPPEQQQPQQQQQGPPPQQQQQQQQLQQETQQQDPAAEERMAAQQQQQPAAQQRPAEAVLRQECADVPISSSHLDLAKRADIIVTGVVLAAGAGKGLCHPNGTLTPLPDGANATQSPPSGSSYVVVGLQCVHKGLVQCRNNTEDLGDCLLLVEAPVLPDSAPCALTGGQRYMFFLQSEPGPCNGYYYAMFQRAYHTIRRPLGGTGCAFYPDFPPADDMIKRINGQCSGNEAAACSLDRCDPRVTRSPCANDTATRCDMKRCAGKFMYYNAIMPSETCYELFTYRTSGLPVNCYGQRYINNRVREIELQQALASAATAGTSGAAGTGAGAGAGPAGAGDAAGMMRQAAREEDNGGN